MIYVIKSIVGKSSVLVLYIGPKSYIKDKELHVLYMVASLVTKCVRCMYIRRKGFQNKMVIFAPVETTCMYMPTFASWQYCYLQLLQSIADVFSVDKDQIDRLEILVDQSP